MTRSGTNYVWASLAVAGGLQATYYTSDTDAHYLSDSTIYSAEATKRIVQTDTTVRNLSLALPPSVSICLSTFWADLHLL